MLRESREELKVKHVEAGCVVLRNLYLLQQRLTQDLKWDRLNVVEELNEVLEHVLSGLGLPVKLDQKESQSLVDRWGHFVSFRSEFLQEPEQKLNRNQG